MQVKFSEAELRAMCQGLHRLAARPRYRTFTLVHTYEPLGFRMPGRERDPILTRWPANGALPEWHPGRMFETIAVNRAGQRWANTLRTARKAPFFNGAAFDSLTWTEPRRWDGKWLSWLLRGWKRGLEK